MFLTKMLSCTEALVSVSILGLKYAFKNKYSIGEPAGVSQNTVIHAPHFTPTLKVMGNRFSLTHWDQTPHTSLTSTQHPLLTLHCAHEKMVHSWEQV